MSHLDNALGNAYRAALHASHDGGRVEIHLGSDVVAALKARIPAEDPLAPASGLIGRTCWGFPVIDSTASPEHISVHTVYTIN